MKYYFFSNDSISPPLAPARYLLLGSNNHNVLSPTFGVGYVLPLSAHDCLDCWAYEGRSCERWVKVPYEWKRSVVANNSTSTNRDGVFEKADASATIIKTLFSQ